MSEKQYNEGDDPRPIAEPNCHSWRELADFADGQAFAAEMRRVWPDVQWGRFTIVSPEHPHPPYPDGWYFEGWTVRPEMMAPPHREGPFNFPLTATLSNSMTDTPNDHR